MAVTILRAGTAVTEIFVPPDLADELPKGLMNQHLEGGVHHTRFRSDKGSTLAFITQISTWVE